jgi:phosphoribosylamine--glycine ligase
MAPLKIALNSYTGYGFHFVLRLLEEGHKVDVFLTEPEYENILGGIIPAPYIQARGSKGYPNYGKYDLSLFDLTGRERQSEYSATLCPTLGDGAFNCAVEDDRMFGLEAMEECGIQVPPYERFTDVGAAKVHVRKSNKRFVYKPDGGQEQDTDTTYVSSSPEDMLANLDKLFAKTKGAPFVLQEFIKGTEVSVEGYFNGDEFYLVNVTLEEKKFMNENLGPNTGCGGNLVFTLNESSELFKNGLGRMRDYLRSVNYTGMIDLNTIATERGLYGLEWTPRFGYDASATLFQMYSGNLGEMLHKTATGQVPDQSWRGEFAAGVRVSIPPYPTEIRGKHPAGVPVKGIAPGQYGSTFMYDVMLQDGELVTAGHSGFVCVPMAHGVTMGDAWSGVDEKIEALKIPNMQHRTDVQKTTSKRYYELSRLGLL